jgi:hypothetical protein
MKNLRHLASRSLHHLGDAATKRAIKQFTTKYHFVYFGHVDPREDEYELVRGVTVSTTHADNHYTVGSYNGHDILLVERHNTLTFPGKQDSTYRWLIMQLDLTRTGLPHIFVDCHHHDAVFYANTFAAHNGVQDMSSYFADLSTAFNQHCRVFASPAHYAAARALLQPKVADALAQFHQFDFEFFEDRVLIYASNNVVTPQLLDDMLRVGVWLADDFNNAVLA